MILGRSRKPAPRLAAELDDTELGRVCRQLAGRGTARTLAAAVIERLLKDTGQDWDRRAHRLAVLAAVTRPATQRSWLDQQSGHPDAQTLFAWGIMARGSRTPPPSAEFEQAVEACATAARLDPYDPNPWVARLGLLRQRRRSRTEVFPIWREIVARDPWHREAHLQMYGYLSPRQCGSHAQAMDFVDRVRATAPSNAPTAGLPLLSLIDRYHAALSQGGVQALTADRLWSGHEAARILDRAQDNWAEPGRLTHAAALADLNLLAYALSVAREQSRAALVFRSIAGVVTAFPWGYNGQDPVLAFTAAQRRAEESH
ncbi:hypothetical protein Sipo8835_30775 [Streptomyces ipomoeae]|jgi:hypothetical protein|uniref:DUF4034 domain-containing protein n=2 Tax=Streptomyces ipomoeae TaxID=103232 RepID=L1KYS4_9ACTN|nr:hypothetical protein [Streptomyces ipomoeae]EKX65640.1 hypothetical protein STRIP9103_08440 [Streptomyces ipomoeae 91-03]MDX2694192.1 hypothetical protein [Streptomyces ipomoeae]MDX2821662.1 hypothetical protein [Streptomyces ipomoeae]MDX2840175.1 hypothetical protein [Streptomyces ipomoeae]MDX2874020.1 hypothetical protein [Streptomyces ipomoeae]